MPDPLAEAMIKKQNEEKEKKESEKDQEFLKELKALNDKYNRAIGAQIDYRLEGLIPKTVLLRLPPPKLIETP